VHNIGEFMRSFAILWFAQLSCSLAWL